MSNNNEEKADTYDKMMHLERLESLREELEENNFETLSGVEAALALIVPDANAETDQERAMLNEIRTEMLDLEVSDLAGVDAKIDELNEQLDELDEE